MTYRCPVCDHNSFSFSTELTMRSENRIANQCRSRYSISINCAKCGEEVMQDEFSFVTNFGERPGVDEVCNRAEQIFNDWLAENGEQNNRELNAFNNCSRCRTSLFVSLEEHEHYWEDGSSDRVYVVACHKCGKEGPSSTYDSLAIKHWNKLNPMEGSNA